MIIKFYFNIKNIDNIDWADNYSTIGLENHLQTNGLLLSYANRYYPTAQQLENETSILFINTRLSGSTGINNYDSSISNYELKQNYPNPFNPITQINYELRITNYELAEIVVYNSAGQQVWSSSITDHSLLVTGSILFDGSKFNSGTYYYSLIVDGKRIDTKAMVLLK